MRHTLSALTMMYVTQRAAIGHINRRSAEQMRSRLRDFAVHAPANPMRVRRSHVEAWMERPDLSAQYQRARLSTLRGFAKWCVANSYMKLDPTLTVEAPPVPQQVPKRMTQVEAHALAEVSRSDPRTRLIVSLSLQEALRRMEVSRLDVENIDFAERTISIRGKGGGGGITDTLPISEETWAALTAYLAIEGHRNGPLIRNRVVNGARLSPPMISDIIRNAMVEAGVKRPGDPSKTPHSTRHTAAHDLLERTQNVRAVQQALRHRSVRSTEVYLRGHVAELRDIMAGRLYFDNPVVPS